LSPRRAAASKRAFRLRTCFVERGRPGRLFREREPQQQRVGVGPAAKQRDDVRRAPAVEQEISVRGEQELVVHAERQRFLEVPLRPIGLVEDDGELGEASRHP
jgi:hypothetical protein